MWQKLTSGTQTTLPVNGHELPCVQFEEYLSLKIEALKRVLVSNGVGNLADLERQLEAL